MIQAPIDVAFAMTEGTLDACYDDSGLSTKTYADRITYTCVVIGNDHDSNSATPSRWSGASQLAGITLGSQVQQLQAPLTVLWAAVLLGQPLAPEAILLLFALLAAVAVAVSARGNVSKSH